MAKDRHAQMRRRVGKAASSLSATERKVLFLGAREGLSNAEIAERIGTTPGLVEQILARALCKFDRALRQQRPWWRFW